MSDRVEVQIGTAAGADRQVAELIGSALTPYRTVASRIRRAAARLGMEVSIRRTTLLDHGQVEAERRDGGEWIRVPELEAAASSTRGRGRPKKARRSKETPEN